LPQLAFTLRSRSTATFTFTFTCALRFTVRFGLPFGFTRTLRLPRLRVRCYAPHGLRAHCVHTVVHAFTTVPGSFTLRLILVTFHSPHVYGYGSVWFTRFPLLRLRLYHALVLRYAFGLHYARTVAHAATVHVVPTTRVYFTVVWLHHVLLHRTAHCTRVLRFTWLRARLPRFCPRCLIYVLPRFCYVRITVTAPTLVTYVVHILVAFPLRFTHGFTRFTARYFTRLPLVWFARCLPHVHVCVLLVCFTLRCSRFTFLVCCVHCVCVRLHSLHCLPFTVWLRWFLVALLVTAFVAFTFTVFTTLLRLVCVWTPVAFGLHYTRFTPRIYVTVVTVTHVYVAQLVPFGCLRITPFAALRTVGFVLPLHHGSRSHVITFGSYVATVGLYVCTLLFTHAIATPFWLRTHGSSYRAFGLQRLPSLHALCVYTVHCVAVTFHYRFTHFTHLTGLPLVCHALPTRARSVTLRWFRFRFPLVHVPFGCARLRLRARFTVCYVYVAFARLRLPRSVVWFWLRYTRTLRYGCFRCLRLLHFALIYVPFTRLHVAVTFSYRLLPFTHARFPTFTVGWRLRLFFFALRQLVTTHTAHHVCGYVTPRLPGCTDYARILRCATLFWLRYVPLFWLRLHVCTGTVLPILHYVYRVTLRLVHVYTHTVTFTHVYARIRLFTVTTVAVTRWLDYYVCRFCPRSHTRVPRVTRIRGWFVVTFTGCTLPPRHTVAFAPLRLPVATRLLLYTFLGSAVVRLCTVWFTFTPRIIGSRFTVYRSVATLVVHLRPRSVAPFRLVTVLQFVTLRGYIYVGCEHVRLRSLPPRPTVPVRLPHYVRFGYVALVWFAVARLLPHSFGFTVAFTVHTAHTFTFCYCTRCTLCGLDTLRPRSWFTHARSLRLRYTFAVYMVTHTFTFTPDSLYAGCVPVYAAVYTLDGWFPFTHARWFCCPTHVWFGFCALRFYALLPPHAHHARGFTTPFYHYGLLPHLWITGYRLVGCVPFTFLFVYLFSFSYTFWVAVYATFGSLLRLRIRVPPVYAYVPLHTDVTHRFTFTFTLRFYTRLRLVCVWFVWLPFGWLPHPTVTVHVWLPFYRLLVTVGLRLRFAFTLLLVYTVYVLPRSRRFTTHYTILHTRVGLHFTFWFSLPAAFTHHFWLPRFCHTVYWFVGLRLRTLPFPFWFPHVGCHTFTVTGFGYAPLDYAYTTPVRYLLVGWLLGYRWRLPLPFTFGWLVWLPVYYARTRCYGWIRLRYTFGLFTRTRCSAYRCYVTTTVLRTVCRFGSGCAAYRTVYGSFTFTRYVAFTVVCHRFTLLVTVGCTVWLRSLHAVVRLPAAVLRLRRVYSWLHFTLHTRCGWLRLHPRFCVTLRCDFVVTVLVCGCGLLRSCSRSTRVWFAHPYHWVAYTFRFYRLRLRLHGLHLVRHTLRARWFHTPRCWLRVHAFHRPGLVLLVPLLRYPRCITFCHTRPLPVAFVATHSTVNHRF